MVGDLDMTLVDWPAEVPSRFQANVSGGPQETRVSFEPEIGAPMERRRTTVIPEMFSITMEWFTRAEFRLWRAWFNETLAAGVHLFRMRHPLTGVPCSWKIARGNPPYSAQLRGSLVEVSFQAMMVRELEEAPQIVSTLITPAGGTAGTTFTAVASVTGTPAPTVTYQWYANGNTIPGATGATYTTAAAVSALHVRVRAVNAYGMVFLDSNPVTVTAPSGGGEVGVISPATVITSSTIFTSAGVQ